eukprot:GHVP01058119.1.p1 GENE.GHVP01058119.1~~GHVP01058119.1.p1  ORF type:complete len:105 (+),score=21.50 GHVP01058119.1:82-396(+)
MQDFPQKCNAEIILEKRGFFIKIGEKFGGDFLLYPGEPSDVHSSHILSTESFDLVTCRELVGCARLASSVKKTFVFWKEEDGFEVATFTPEKSLAVATAKKKKK